MILSILIPTLTARHQQLNKLNDELLRQIELLPVGLDKVEVINCPDNGEMSVGAKRQYLLTNCNGEYIVFIDDDDWIADDYVLQILQALQTKPDCIGFKGVMITNGHTHDKWSISHNHKNWAKGKMGYVRHTNHLTPVKREIALKVGFNNKRYSEDYDYSMALLPHLKTEVFIDKEMYIYNYQSKK